MNRKMLSMKSSTSWFWTSREVLGHGQAGQGDAEAGARRLVHLTEDQGGLARHAALGHLLDEVVALTGALADAGEHRHTAVVARDAGDHLLDEDGLADTGATEQADLAAEDVGRQKVDDLDARLEHVGLRLELVERRRLAVDRPALRDLELLAVLEVQAVARGVEDVAHGHVADRDGDALAGVPHRGATDQAVGRLHGDGTDHVVADVLGDLEHSVWVSPPCSKSTSRAL